MAEIRLALVNGTGPAGTAYDEAMQSSFCHQLTQKLNTRSFYRRGPRLLGQEVKEEARAVYRWLKAANQQDPSIRLMAAGYSRGGSAAIMACEMLERDNIAIDSLVPF